DLPGFRWRHLDGDTELLPGVTVLRTDGHTPGHQSLLVELPETGPVILTGDACYWQEHADKERVPGVVWNPTLALHSLKKLKTIARLVRGRIFPGHDPVFWDTVKQAPDAYRGGSRRRPPAKRRESHERRTPIRGQRHAHHGAAGSVRSLPGSEVQGPDQCSGGGRRQAKRGAAGLTIVDGLPTSDVDIQQYRKRVRNSGPQSTQPLSGSRLFDTGRLDFAVERDYHAVAQVMGMEMEGVDIAVNYPTAGLALLGRDDMDPQMSLAICQAYNNWIHEFCSYSPDQLKWVAMLPVHDVHLACKELVRCVRELGAVGSFIGPNLVNGHYWHSNYWDPLYSVHEELNATWGFHEGVSAIYSRMIPLYGENRFYRHVASHWIEMQQALIAMIIGGVFE